MPILLDGDGSIGGVSGLSGGNFQATSLETTSGGLLVHEVSSSRYTLRVDATNNTVGINTSSAPAAGTFLQIADATDPIVSLNNTGNGEVRLGCTATAGYIGTESNHPFNIEANSATAVTVLANGNIGIGGTLPASPNIALNADGTAEFADDVTIGNNMITLDATGGNGTFNYSVNAARFNSTTTTAAYSGYDGNNGDVRTFIVGPDGTTQIGGGLGNTTDNNSPNISLNADGSADFVGDVESDTYFYSKNTNNNSAGMYLYNFSASPTLQAIEISSSPSAADRTVSINYDGSAMFGNGNISLGADGLISISGPNYNPITHRTSVQYGQGFQTFGTGAVVSSDTAYAASLNSSPTSRITYGGVFQGTNTTIQPISSERRLKENITAIDPDTAWETIKSTPYYAYNFTGNASVSYGPMADEVPSEMVVNTDQSDDKGVIRTFDNGMLQARLYTALQTALTRIEALEAKVQALGVSTMPSEEEVTTGTADIETEV